MREDRFGQTVGLRPVGDEVVEQELSGAPRQRRPPVRAEETEQVPSSCVVGARTPNS